MRDESSLDRKSEEVIQGKVVVHDHPSVKVDPM
jgi:hypothetical protein